MENKYSSEFRSMHHACLCSALGMIFWII